MVKLAQQIVSLLAVVQELLEPKPGTTANKSFGLFDQVLWPSRYKIFHHLKYMYPSS